MPCHKEKIDLFFLNIHDDISQMTDFGKIVLIEQEYGKYFVHFTQQTGDITVESILPELDTTNIWLRAFQPVQIVIVIGPATISDLDKYTITYMDHYGIANVRSRKYLTKTDSCSLDREVYKTVLQELCGEEKGRQLFIQGEREKYHGNGNDDEKKTPIDEKYNNGPYLDEDYYNKTMRCDYCFRKDAHIENCFYGNIRPLPFCREIIVQNSKYVKK